MHRGRVGQRDPGNRLIIGQVPHAALAVDDEIQADVDQVGNIGRRHSDIVGCKKLSALLQGSQCLRDKVVFIPRSEKRTGAHHQRGRMALQHGALGCRLASAVNTQRRDGVCLDIRGSLQSVEYQVARKSGQVHPGSRTRGGQIGRTVSILAEAAFDVALRRVDPDVTAGVDHRPGAVARDCARHRCRVCDVHILSGQHPIRQMALLADAGECPPQRTARAGYQDRRAGEGARCIVAGRACGIEKPAASAPPAQAMQSRVRRRRSGGQFLHQASEGGGARHRGANVEGSRLVIPLRTGDQTVPVERAEQRPCGDRPQVHPLLPDFLTGLPNFEQPAQLVFASGIDMRLGHRQRNAVALPDLDKQRRDPGRGRGGHARHFEVHTWAAVDHSRGMAGKTFRPMVQPTFAGDVIVDTDYVWRTWVIPKPQQLSRRDTASAQVAP